MCARRMHADEVELEDSAVRRLLTAQFPRWSTLPLARLPAVGTDHVIYRLGQDLAVRLPRTAGASAHVAREQHWLPQLAPHLPLATPVPLATGMPGEGYPFEWSIRRWLEGEDASVGHLTDPRRAATALGRFVAALQQLDPAGGPRSRRGEPLSTRDAPTRGAIEALRGIVDADAVTAAWDAALQVPAWDGPPVWTHGDLLPGNLLLEQGELRAVIDFGCVGVGDPAVDTIAAWSVLPAASRDLFRTTLAVDDATWARGRGWALTIALVILPYYRHTNPTLVAVATRMLEAVLADHAQTT